MTANKSEARSDAVSAFLLFVEQSRRDYEFSASEKTRLEAEINDIEHRMELETMTYHERARLAKELGEKLRQRREAKDTIEILEPIYKFYLEQKNAPFFNGLRETLGAMRKIEKKLSTRFYKCKAEAAYIKNGKREDASA
jgi:hypothetical protein